MSLEIQEKAELPEIPIKLEPESPIDSDMLPEDLAFNSDQDDAGSNIWDFTDEEFKEEPDSQENSFDEDVMAADLKKPMDTSKSKDPFDEFERMHSDFNDRFVGPTAEKSKMEMDEKTLNTLFFQSIDWRKINNDFPYAIPGVKDFDVVDGVQVPELLEESDPYVFFQEFLQDSFLDTVAEFTNKNYELDPRTKMWNLKKKPWRAVDKEDIRMFFGLLFLFGLMKKPNIPSYWSQDPLISTECMNRIMSRGRFAEIKRYICFYDKTKPKPPNDAFYKIREFQDHVINNSKRVYIPERDLSVDESIILYTGLHRLKVYMPQKPNRYGFKAFVLSEASTGYMCNLIMNEGRLKGNTEESFTKRIVLEILKEYQDKGYRVYMDRYYTSAELFMEMKRKGIGACGTVLLNRLKLEKRTLNDILLFKDNDSSIFYTNDSMMFTIFYHYKRQVHMISNFHDNSLTKVEKIKKTRGLDKKELQVLSVDTPTMIRDYQFKMKGVDLFNQRMSYYSTNFRSLRWYFRIIYFYMEIAMINSYLVYVKIQNKLDLRAKSHADYRTYVIKKMVNWQGPERIETKNSAFIREQYHMNPQDGAKKYAPSIYDSKILSFNGNSIDLPCEIDKARLSQKCMYCDSGKKEGKFRKTLWVCKTCKKYCCKGTCFLKHKIHLFLKGVLQAGQGNEFINMLLGSKKLKILENDKEIGKLENIDVEEYLNKKKSILQYKRNSMMNNEFIEEKSEKSLTITNIEEIRNEDFYSENSDNTVFTNEKKKGKKSAKGGLEFQDEIKEIDQMFPIKRKKGRPKGYKMKQGRKNGDEDEDFEFDKALKMSIRRKVGDESKLGERALFKNVKEFYGLGGGENQENEQIFEGFEGKVPEKSSLEKPTEDPSLIPTIEKPSLINTKLLYRYDPSKNALKICKSKLLSKNPPSNSKPTDTPFKELKKRGRKSRYEKNLDFLILDLYKIIDLRAVVKTSAEKPLDYLKLFADLEENNDYQGFQLVKAAEEGEKKPRESSEEKEEREFRKKREKRGRPRSLQKTQFEPSKLRKKRIINFGESKEKSVSLESKSKSSSEEDRRTGRNLKVSQKKKEISDKIKTLERKKKESEEFEEWDKEEKEKPSVIKQKISNENENKNNLKKQDEIKKRKSSSDESEGKNKLSRLKKLEENNEKIEKNKKKEESLKKQAESIKEDTMIMEEEEVNDFYIELEISEEEKSSEESIKKPPIEESMKKHSKTPEPPTNLQKKKEKEKLKNIPEIVEIDDEDDVMILEKPKGLIEVEEEKNIWLNPEDNEGNRVNFDFDHDLEDSLE